MRTTDSRGMEAELGTRESERIGLLGLLLPLRMISGRGSSRRARIVRKERPHSLKYVML
ncbi:hypothetical protein HanIR_Chr04g0191551 [Helianthus annuus]|nr:hypothetical protein HanIR_Chr04g0191551 [Helianthus annuus]